VAGTSFMLAHDNESLVAMLTPTTPTPTGR
jgi:hypothetical protein